MEAIFGDSRTFLPNCSLLDCHHLASPHTLERAHFSRWPAHYQFVNLTASP